MHGVHWVMAELQVYFLLARSDAQSYDDSLAFLSFS